MEWSIRPGIADDARSLAQLSLLAGHGFLDVLYRDLFPRREIEDVIVARRSLNHESVGYFKHWRVATNERDQVLGGVNDFLPQELEGTVMDPAVPDDRRAIFAPFQELDPYLENSVYINMLAVFPEFRHHGIARALVNDSCELARVAGLRAVSLLTFDEDERLVRYYESLGFVCADTRPVVQHEYFRHAGNVVAMVMPIT